MEHLEKKAKEHSEIAIDQKIKYMDAEYEMNIVKREMQEAERTTENMK